MKRILLIGKLNDTIRDINEYLSKYFQMQIAAENTEIVKGMLKIMKPDLVMLSLIGMFDGEDEKIFILLNSACPNTPVLTIGTESEASAYAAYYEQPQFENLLRPVSNSFILEQCLQRLQMTEEEALATNRPKHVLVVDDSAVTLRSMKKMLDSYYSVAVATSGAQAMTAIGRKRPDLILLDYEMPICDGRQTLEMIRADEELQDIPVIFLTGVSDKAHIEAVLELKPAGYFLKPAVEETLLKSIHDVLFPTD